MRIHVVQKGDSLWKIAKKYNVDHDVLKKTNHHLNSESLKPGMKVKVPTSGVPVKKSKGFKKETHNKVPAKKKTQIKAVEKEPVKETKPVPKAEKSFKKEGKEISPAKIEKKPVHQKGKEAKKQTNPRPTSTGTPSSQAPSAPGGWSFHYPPSEFESLSPSAQQQQDTPQHGANITQEQQQIGVEGSGRAGFSQLNPIMPETSAYGHILGQSGGNAPQGYEPAQLSLEHGQDQFPGYVEPQSGVYGMPQPTYNPPQMPSSYNAPQMQQGYDAGHLYGAPQMQGSYRTPQMYAAEGYTHNGFEASPMHRGQFSEPIPNWPTNSETQFPFKPWTFPYEPENREISHETMGRQIDGQSANYEFFRQNQQQMNPNWPQLSGCGCEDPSRQYAMTKSWGPQPQMAAYPQPESGPSYWVPNNEGASYPITPPEFASLGMEQNQKK